MTTTGRDCLICSCQEAAVSSEMGKKINERKVIELRDKDHSSQDFVSLGPWPSCS